MSTALARLITIQLGGCWYGQHGTVPGPGHSKRDRSTSVRGNPDDPDDVIVNSFSGHDYREIKDDWRVRGLLPAKGFRRPLPPKLVAKALAAARKADAEKEAAAAAERLKIALSLWARRKPADGTVVGLARHPCKPAAGHPGPSGATPPSASRASRSRHA